MTKAELDKLERLCAAATPGPWTVDPSSNRVGRGDPNNPAEWSPLSYADSDAVELMAASRTAVPKLIDYVRFLQSRLDRVFNALLDGDSPHAREVDSLADHVEPSDDPEP